jgi:hypothetical protein
MSIVLGDINYGLEHQDRKGYSWDPADKADYVENREDEEDNGCAVVMSGEVYDRCANAKDDLKDTSDPNGSAMACQSSTT